MKITEISDHILNALRRERFVGNFEVTIHRPPMQDIKITGHKRTADEFPYDFSCKLQMGINEICFRIVRSNLSDSGFTFDIKGSVEYVFEYKE